MWNFWSPAVDEKGSRVFSKETTIKEARVTKNPSRLRRRRLLGWLTAGALAALGIAIPVAVFTGAAGAGKRQAAAADDLLDATYSPLKLRVPGDPAEVRYDISCLPSDGNPDGNGSCDASGTVYFRAGATAASVPLHLDPAAQSGRYLAPVPASIWASPWFTYYAVVHDDATGHSITLPQGGSTAPQMSFAINGSTTDLGEHAFGSTQSAVARVAQASWGTGDGQVGLEDGIDQAAGGSAFDVDSSGDLYLLDEANSRLLEFSGLSAPVPTAVTLPGLTGVRADLRVSASAGIAYVLEMTTANQAAPVLRAFTLQGAPLAASQVADSTAAQVRLSGSSAYVSEYPSSMWAPVLQSNGQAALDASSQVAREVPGTPGVDGNVIVSSLGNEIRVGAYVPVGTTYRLTSARLTSSTPVADVQLTQVLPSGRIVVVFSVYTDTAHEYEAVVLDSSGNVVEQFSLPADDWAQSMPLSRFRLDGSSLYELGSTSAGIFVDRYDLGVS
jgi:hypothetical protein